MSDTENSSGNQDQTVNPQDPASMEQSPVEESQSNAVFHETKEEKSSSSPTSTSTSSSNPPSTPTSAYRSSTSSLSSQPSSDSEIKKTGAHKEWIRAKNYEESMPFIANFFYCFYFYYICKVDPITEVDIPTIAKKDETMKNTEDLRKNWEPVCSKYLEEYKQFEQEKKNNPEFVFVYFIFHAAPF